MRILDFLRELLDLGVIRAINRRLRKLDLGDRIRNRI
jgi:ABC-type uncharacterized transport system ATPase subunit